MDNKQNYRFLSFIWNIAIDVMAHSIKNGDNQVVLTTFNDDIICIVAGMLEENIEFA